jgi:hypothetical protein
MPAATARDARTDDNQHSIADPLGAAIKAAVGAANTAPLAVLFDEFCERIGLPVSTGKRMLAQKPEHLPPAFTIGCRRYVLLADCEDWLKAIKARARAA